MSRSDKAARAAKLVAKRALGGPVDNPNFRNWFAGSAATDPSGQPMRLYHGTQGDFDSFDKEKVGSNPEQPYSFGFHLTTRPQEASAYADSTDNLANKFNPDSRFAKPVKSGANVMPVYASVKNPLVLHSDHAAASMTADLDRGDIARKLVEAKRAGRPHDGVIIHRHRGDEYDHSNVIVFHPNQIKSATGNNGNFDPNDPRVTKAGGGSLSDAINSFSQQRNAQLTRPGAGDVNAQLAMYQQPRQLMVAEEPQRRAQQPMSQGVGDLGAEIDKGAQWLSGTPNDDDPPAPPKKPSTPAQSANRAAPTGSGDPISTVLAGIQHLETGGLKDPYHYVSPAGAMGAYGVMPKTLSGWTKGTKYEGISSQDYLNNPSIQDDVARIGASNYYNQYNGDVSKVGQAWLGGPGSVGKSNKDPWTGISTDQYGSNLANIVNSQHPQPQTQAVPPQPAATPAPQPQASTNGPQAQADPMSNLYNKVALGPQVAAGYDNPQALFDPTNAKRGGRMRKRFDDGGSSGDGGDGGDGGGDGGDGTSAAAAAAGYGGVGDAGGAPAGTSTTGTGGFGSFGGGDATGTSVGVNSTSAPNANAGFGGQGVATNSAPGGAGGVSTGGVGFGGAPAASGVGGGATGGGGGTAAGGAGYGGTPAFYDAGFGLGVGGQGNAAAANSNTALQDSLSQTQMKYGFVNGNDPGLANSNTGQSALSQAQVMALARGGNQQAQAALSEANQNGSLSPGSSAAPALSLSEQAQAINALMAQYQASHGGTGAQGFGGQGFGGGSPSATVGGFGGNSSPTGAEGVNTASLGPGTSLSQDQQFALARSGDQQTQLALAQAQQKGPSPAQQAPPPPVSHAATPPASTAGRTVARGGYLQRASGGSIDVSSIPTNELIQYALDRLRHRRNAATGGAQSPGPEGVSMKNWALSGSVPGLDPRETAGFLQTMDNSDSAAQTPAAPPAPTPAPNTPAIPSGTVGNQGGIGSPGFASGAPIGGIPNAQPNGQASNSTNPSGPQYNNSIDQALQTNNPTSNQVFGFTYPSVPPPKPQPVGPVPQSLINGEFGAGSGSQIGTGSEFFRAGGAVIMDAALNRARKAIKGNKRNV